LLAEADFVVPLAVATPETENLIGAAAFRLMRRHAFLINLSRGNLIDESALVAALDEERIAGAAMDVGRAPDQMPSPHLAHRKDVVATPHIGGLTQPAIEGQSLETVEQVADIVHGRAPKGAVNANHATRLAQLARSASNVLSTPAG
jgi:D-3-phosphoglycerate dehydrogenase